AGEARFALDCAARTAPTAERSTRRSTPARPRGQERQIAVPEEREEILDVVGPQRRRPGFCAPGRRGADVIGDPAVALEPEGDLFECQCFNVSHNPYPRTRSTRTPRGPGPSRCTASNSAGYGRGSRRGRAGGLLPPGPANKPVASLLQQARRREAPRLGRFRAPQRQPEPGLTPSAQPRRPLRTV